MSRSSRPVLRAAVIGVTVLALGLGLSACGRKGALDPPPGGSLIDQPTGAPTDTDQYGRPIAPPGQKKRLPIDWLLD